MQLGALLAFLGVPYAVVIRGEGLGYSEWLLCEAGTIPSSLSLHVVSLATGPAGHLYAAAQHQKCQAFLVLVPGEHSLPLPPMGSGQSRGQPALGVGEDRPGLWIMGGVFGD